MTSLALENKNRDDYPGAAKKHLNDAAALFGAGRLDGAGYLVGYAVECSLRTVVLIGEVAVVARIPQHRLHAELDPGSKTWQRFRKVGGDKARSEGRGHDLDSLAKATTGYAHVLNSQSATYAPRVDTTAPPFSGAWTEGIRYRAEGSVTREEAEAWLKRAEQIYQSTIEQMLRDGILRA